MGRKHRLRRRTGLASESFPANSRLYINLHEGRDYDGTPIFADAVRNSRGFQEVAFSVPSVALDASGWPLADFRTIVHDLPSNQAWQVGTWKGSFTSKNGGAETISFAGSSTGLSLANVVHATSTTFDIVATSSAVDMFLDITGTTNGVTDFKLIRPGYSPSSPPTFTDDVIAQGDGFAGWRFMDFARTNGNAEVNWADRYTPTTKRTDPNGLSGDVRKGNPWELAIELCNTTNKHGWFNIPQLATDAYITSFATLLRDTMDVDLIKNIEPDNETWNVSFAQEGQNRAAAIADAAANPGVLDYDNIGGIDQYTLARRRAFQRARAISIIFQTVFGSRYAAEVRIHAGSQLGNPYNLNDQFKFINTVYGPPANWFYAATCGAYVNQDNTNMGGSDQRFTDGLSTAQVLAGLSTNATEFERSVKCATEWDVCQHWGVKLSCYEFGIDTNFSGSTASKQAAQIDAGMQAIQTLAIRRMYDSGTEMICGYKSGVEPGGVGFGLFNSSTGVLTSPKYLSYLEYQAGRGTPTKNYGVGTFDARLCADYWSANSTYPDLNDIQKNQGFLWVHWVPVTGTYALTITYASSASGTVDLEVNNVSVATNLSVTNSGGANAAMAPQNVTLVAGQANMIRWGRRNTGYSTISVKQVQIA